jgi:hypothetical protein
MSLIDFIRKKSGIEVAIPAIPATQDRENDGIELRIARIATIAVANPANEKLSVLACSWMITLPEVEFLTVYVPAVSLARIQRDHPTLIRAEIAQGCSQCLWNTRPGHTVAGYCSSPDRQNQPGPYGAVHPARDLPGDGGAACEYLESSKHE